jgi:carbonic anhydrase
MRTLAVCSKSSLVLAAVAAIALVMPTPPLVSAHPPVATGHAPAAQINDHAPRAATPPVSKTSAEAIAAAAKSGVSPSPTAHGSPSAGATATATAQQSLQMLAQGNARWIADQCIHPNDERSRRADLAVNGQHPFATILTCSDSRLPAERIFDCGVGDIFVIRVAGNTMGVSETATIEYGTEHLQTPLLVVMGHTSCGAVKAACSHAHLEGSLPQLVAHIEPAVERAERLNPTATADRIIDEAIRENVWQSIFDLLKTSEIARTLVGEGRLKIVGAVCDISTGKIEFLGEHPWQSELITAMNSRGADNTHAAVSENDTSH